MSRILLVDDEPGDVNRNRTAFEAAGHEVLVAATSARALDEIARQPPDAIVTEAMLDGGQAGFDLARSLAHSHPQVPVVMLTRVDDVLSRAERERQDRDGWLPVARFLEKPVMPDVLVYEVEHLLAAIDWYGRFAAAASPESAATEPEAVA